MFNVPYKIRFQTVFNSKDHCNLHQLFIVTLLQLLIPVIQTIFFRCRDFQSQKLNVFFLDQNRRNFTPQKLPVIQYFHGKNTVSE